MTQNGPYPEQSSQSWSADDSAGTYREPADPWSGQHEAWNGGSTAAVPELAPYGHPVWAKPAPRRRSGPMMALVVLLAVAALAGLGGAGWLWWRSRTVHAVATAAPPVASRATAAGDVAPAPRSSQDGRFAVKGQCVRNEGTAQAPQMSIVACADGTYEVLARVDGPTTGAADAETKCATVRNYTKWYFYDSDLDSLDFVLCLRER